MNEKKVFIKTELNGAVNEYSGESAIIINIQEIEREQGIGGKEKFGVKASVGVIGRKYNTEITPDLYAQLFLRAIRTLAGNGLEEAFLLSEIADRLKNESEEIMDSISAEEFAKMASESLTELFKDVFKK